MKTSKRLLAMLLTIFIVSGLTIFGQQSVEEHWSYSFIKQLMDSHLLSRAPSNTDELDEFMTKDEFYQQLRKNELITESIAGRVGEKIYIFDSSDIYLTREEACIILGGLINKEFSTELYFIDQSELSDEGHSAMMKLNYFYIVDGYPDGFFSPGDLITRAEALKLMSLMSKVPAEYLSGFVNYARDEKDESGYRSNKTIFQLLVPSNTFDMPFDLGSRSPITVLEPENETGSEPVDMAERFMATQEPLVTVPQDTATEPVTLRSVPVPTAAAIPEKATPIPTQKPSPLVTVSASMGSRFRSIDVRITTGGESCPVMYYLALEAGSDVPEAADIIGYSEGKKTEGLTNGTVVRGKLITGQSSFNKKLTLHGGDDVKRIAGETGFIDGYRYDFYLVGVDSEGNRSNIAASKNVMAMPFEAADFENNTYTIRSISVKQINERHPDLHANNKNNKGKIYRTARQLENIQRLADLYGETGGKHGDVNFLTGSWNTYVLDDDMDLSAYKGFDGERGWIPIGNADDNEAFSFGGSFDGKYHKISNLYIDRDINLSGSNVACQGLFGKVSGATIRNLTLDDAKIIVEGVGDRNESYVGALAGHAKNSVIDNITLDSLSMKVYSPSTIAVNSVGGLIGFSENSDIDSITVNNADITTKNAANGTIAYSDYTGGVTGSFIDLGEANLLTNIDVSGIIDARGYAAGGVAGRIKCEADSDNRVFAYNINSTMRIDGEAFCAGGIAGRVDNSSMKSSITFENCYASGTISGAGNIGGIFGTVSSLTKSGFVLKASASEADVRSENIDAIIGGVVALTSGGSYEYCESVGSTLKSGMRRIGGFAGYITGDTDFIGCMSSKSVDANDIAGGFAGEVNGNVNFYRCSSQSRVINARGTDAGGFLGLQSGGNVLLGSCFATGAVTGRENMGGFAGRIGENASGEFINCYSSGDIAGDVNAGGFIGRLDSEHRITDSFSTGKVDAGGKEGNFIGNRF